MTETDVLVVGAGPAGITLANLLGVYGVRAIVIDREPEILDYPRAVGIDDESLRVFQAAGAADEVVANLIPNTAIRYYSSSGGLLAHVKPSAQPFGWPRRNLFLQPMFEATMREMVKRFESGVEVRYGCELLEASQDADRVSARVRKADGGEETIHASYMVGSDGGRSTVRKVADIPLTGETAAGRWLVVDVAEDRLDKPYAAVYCHPKRPILMVPLPYRHRRWEFKLTETEDEAAVTSPESVTALIAPQYGAIPLPRVLRARVYWHHSRIAKSFRSGRMFLAGDAAHLQPPFFGQGMNSGVRDVGNLAWKLAAVLRGQAGQRALDSYDTERRHHAEEMVDFVTWIGRLYTPANRLTEIIRDGFFRAVQRLPGGREYILQMKFKPMPRYDRGFVAGGGARGLHPAIGRMFMQPVIERNGRREKFDEALGPWFAVVGLNVDPTAGLSAEALAWWRSLGARFVQVDGARSGPARGMANDSPSGADVRVEDVEGAFRDHRLDRARDEIVVLRPDRYVAAVCDRDGLERVTAELRELFS